MRAPFTTLALLSLTLAACSNTTGPSAPSVEGIWTGTWGDATVQLTLSQQGDRVSGTLRVARALRQVTGTLSAGTLRIASEVNRADCSVYDSDRLTFSAAAGTLSGMMFKTTGQPVCDGNRGRVGVEQAMLSLTR